MKTQFVFLKILHLVNRRGWQEWTEISNKRLMEFSDICCETTFFRHRDRLVELGFIGYKKGKKGQPNKYKIIEKKFIELKKGFIASCTDKEFCKSMSENTCEYTSCDGGERKNCNINSRVN